MQQARDVPGRLRFGIFEADLRTGELRKRGTRVRLQEQPFQVLALLLARPGDLVTRDEIRGRLWAADTFVDEFAANLAIESSVFPLPSELVIPPAGVLVAQGRMDGALVILAGTVGLDGGL